MGTLANREVTDEMLHKVTCHLSLYCLLRKIDLQRKKFNIFFFLLLFFFGGGGGIMACIPSIYTADHPDTLTFHCESLNEPLHLRCSSYLHVQIDLSHTHIHAILGGERQSHPITLLFYCCLCDVEHVSP